MDLMDLSTAKYAIYLAIITAIIAGIAAGYNAIEQSGYDRAKAELFVEHKNELSRITLQLKDEIDAAKHEAEHYRAQAVLIQQKEPVILTKWKEKIIHENPDCTKLNGFSVMLNESIKRFDI